MQFSLALDEDSVMVRAHARLLARFGPQRDAERADPVSQLVYGIISGDTRDDVSGAAFERLRQRYPRWELLGKAPPPEVERLIWTVNHREPKAQNLPRALRMITARCGSLNLDFLADWDEEMAMQWLQGLPGVGPKVAASVLNFSTLRKRVLAVDRHLLRVGKRLGLLPQRAEYDLGHDAFMRLVPDAWSADELYEFHWQMKSLSRTVCTETAPACGQCPLQELCLGAPMAAA